MTNKLRLGIAAAVVAQCLAGCGTDAGRTSLPTAPSAPSPPPSVTTGRQPAPWPPGVFAPNVTLGGVVLEIVNGAEVPIEGVWVYCELCTEETHAGMYTDHKGAYAFTGVWGDSLWINVGKIGYDDPSNPPNGFPRPGWREVKITGDTRFNVELARK